MFWSCALMWPTILRGIIYKGVHLFLTRKCNPIIQQNYTVVKKFVNFLIVSPGIVKIVIKYSHIQLCLKYIQASIGCVVFFFKWLWKSMSQRNIAQQDWWTLTRLVIAVLFQLDGNVHFYRHTPKACGKASHILLPVVLDWVVEKALGLVRIYLWWYCVNQNGNAL